MLNFSQLSFQAGTKTLFKEADAQLHAGQRIGLIGRNGTGKSTLLKLILGQLQPDGGDIQCTIPAHEIAHLAQSLPETTLSAIEYVKHGDYAWSRIQQQLQHATEHEDGIAIAECHARLQDIDGYTIDTRAAIILHGLGFTNDTMHNAVSQFSGGWMMRLQLARVLLSRSDLLLLDEPTNHLDLEAITWLERWLQQQSTSMIIISHDRDILDSVCTQILHLNQQQLQLYTGNYTAFVKQYELKLEIQAREKEKVDRQKAHMQKFVDRFRAKATKAKQAQSRLKAIEKLTFAPTMQRENPFHFEFMPTTPLASPILTLKGSAGYSKNPILQHINLNLMADDRLALIGLNGAGKTTLIKTLVEELPLLTGERVAHPKLTIGYYSQQQVDALIFDNTPLQHILKACPHMGESNARRYLGGFDFKGDRVFDTVGRFSGGEKARLALALLITQQPNILLLDEPTNHLDIQMREALILALQSFEGAVVVVSHDTHFVNSTATSLCLIEAGQVKRFNGSLADYQQHVLESKQASTSNKSTATTQQTRSQRQSKQPNPQKIKQLEKTIIELSASLKTIEATLNEGDLYLPENQKKLVKIQDKAAYVRQQLAKTEETWLKLQDDA